MANNDLKWIIENTPDEVDYYLETVTNEQFVLDVKKLIVKSTNTDVVRETIKKLEELLPKK